MYSKMSIIFIYYIFSKQLLIDKTSYSFLYKYLALHSYQEGICFLFLLLILVFIVQLFDIILRYFDPTCFLHMVH